MHSMLWGYSISLPFIFLSIPLSILCVEGSVRTGPEPEA